MHFLPLLIHFVPDGWMDQPNLVLSHSPVIQKWPCLNCRFYRHWWSIRTTFAMRGMILDN
jgi:hypothetical protein